MVVNAFFISLLYIIVKILTNDFNFSSNQVGLLYKLSILILTLISCLKLGFIHHLKTKKLFFHALRGFFSIMGSLCMFYAVSVLNVLNAAAISELTPAFMVIAGVLVFNEKLTTPKIVLLLGSITGIFFIRDFTAIGKDFNSGYWFAFSALIFWSINNVIIKKLTKTEHSRAQLFYSSLFASIFAFPVAYFQYTFDFTNYSIDFHLATWPDFSVTSLLFILSAGLASLLHKVSFFRAYKLSDMSVVGPFDYLRLPFTGIFAYLILDERINNKYSLIGYGLIVLSGVYFIMHKEKRSK
jgi:drug/metabolite transporter (DMT)-like permease